MLGTLRGRVGAVASSRWQAVPQLRRPLCTGEPLLLADAECGGRVAVLTMNDRRRRNALSLSLIRRLHEEIQTHAADDNVRCIVLSGGAAGKAFSSGHDLRELRTEAGLTQHAKVFAACTELMTSIQSVGVPVIAEVNGVAAAAGCQLAATCDIAVASPRASFLTPGSLLAGIFCSTPGVALVRSVGRKVAMDMLLTGRTLDAREALSAGLVSRVSPTHGGLRGETMAVAGRVLRQSRRVVAIGKAFAYAQMQLDTHSAYRHGEKVMVDNLRLADCQNAIDAFIAKRPPVWTHSDERVH